MKSSTKVEALHIERETREGWRQDPRDGVSQTVHHFWQGHMDHIIPKAAEKKKYMLIILSMLEAASNVDWTKLG